MNIPLLGTPIVPSRFGSKYTAGHVFENGQHMFVTTGILSSIVPIRFVARRKLFYLQLTGKTSGKSSLVVDEPSVMYERW